jgi:hypothetical protein
MTPSTPTWWLRQWSMKVRLKPESHQSLAKRPERPRARSATVIPPGVQYGATRSAMSAHSLSLMSPWVVRQV